MQLIQDFQPRVIMVTPSYMLTVIDEFEKQGIDPRSSSLEIGIFGAEPWTEQMRQEMEERLDIEAIDIYGLSEVMGPGVAQECVETKDGLHIWEDHFYPEVIDPFTGEVLPEGEKGELVFTSLTKEAMPVIRYRTRDLTRLLPGTARPGMRRMEKVTGRTDDMIILRGVNLFPTQIEEIVLRTPGLSPHFAMELTTRGRMDHLTVRIEARPDCPAERREPGRPRGAEGRQGHRRHERRGARRRPGHAAAVGGEAAAAGRPPGAPVSSTPNGSPRGAAGPGTRWTRCSTPPSRCSTSAATRRPASTRWPPGSASPSRRSTTTCPARWSCCGWRSTGRWTRCSPSPRRPGRPPARRSTGSSTSSAGRSGCWRRSCRSSPCCCGCAATPRSSGRRCSGAGSSTAIVTGLVRAAEHEGDVRTDVDPAVISRLLFGTVNSLTEWYRPGGDLSADDLADAVVTVTFSGLRT